MGNSPGAGEGIRVGTVVTSRTIHDLNGPIINAEAFHREIAVAVKTLETTLETHSAEIPAAALDVLMALVQDDIKPCLEHAAVAVEQLRARVSQAQ